MTTNLVRVLFVVAVAMIVRPISGWAQAERAIYVSVLDQCGAPVSDLAGSDFVVREGGVPREVLRVSAATSSLQIAVLVDTSQAIEPYISEVRSALKSFSREIQDRHERALFAFGERPTVVADYSRDPAHLEAGIGRLFAQTGSGASVLDAIIEVSRGLRQRKATRPVIVVITAEGSELSHRDHQTVLDDLRETNVTLHSFVLAKAGGGAGMTGGRREELLNGKALEGRLQGLAAELNNQYLVIYAQPGSVIRPYAVDVNVKRSGLTVRAPLAPWKPGATCAVRAAQRGVRVPLDCR